MKTNIIFAVVCIAILGIVVACSTKGVASTPPVMEAGQTELGEAIRIAEREGKIVFAVATADWCGPCQTYKRSALVDPQVTSWLEEHAVTVTLDLTSGDNPDATALGVRSIPATFIINADGELVGQHAGTMGASDLRRWLESSAG